MPIYRYTLRKYLVAPSTWVVLAFSAIGVGFILGGLVPFVFVSLGSKELTRNYLNAVIGTVSGVTIFMAIFVSVFSGFKSASLYKDEVENGTFLSLISKPIKRSTIIFEKWLALLTVLVGYAFISVLFYCISISIFDIGDTLFDELSLLGAAPLRNDIFRIGGFIFIIVFVSGLIFSSLGILLSVRLSTGATIGTMIATGVFIPITALLSAFLKNDPARTFTDSNFLVATSQYNNVIAKARKDITTAVVQATLGNNTLPQIPGVVNLQNLLITQTSQLLYPHLDSQAQSFIYEVETNRYPYLGAKTGAKDQFSNLFWLDLNYQYSKMGELVYTEAIPSGLKQAVAATGFSSALSPQKVNVDASLSGKEFAFATTKFLRSFSPLASAVLQITDLNFLFHYNWYSMADLTATVNNEHYTPSVPLNKATYEEIKSAIDKAATTSQSNIGLNRDFINLDRTVMELSREMAKGYPDPANVTKIFVSPVVMRDLFALVSKIPTPIDIALATRSSFFNVGEIFTEMANFDINELVRLEEADPQPTTMLGLRKFIERSLRDFFGEYTTNFTDKKELQFIYDTIDRRVSVLSPLTESVFYSDRIRTFINDQVRDNAINTTFSRKELLSILNGAGEDGADEQLELSYRDVSIFSALYGLAQADLLVKYHFSDYATKESLIIGYVLVALILVPLTYPVIKRQDFR